MGIFNALISSVFDGFFGLAGMLGGAFALWLISALAGVLLLLIFKATSNQAAIRRAKDDIQAGFLEVRLFKDDLGRQMSALGRIFAAAFRYMGHALAPMLWMIVPVLLLLIQMNHWYGYRPLRPGERALVLVRLEAQEHLDEMDIELKTADDGVAVSSPALRIELPVGWREGVMPGAEQGYEVREVDWRIDAVEEGRHELVLRIGDGEVRQAVQVGGGFTKIVPARVRGAWDELWNPGASPLPDGSPVAGFEVVYPEGEADLLGLRMHWVVVFFILSVVFGFAFKGLLRVEI